MILIQGSSSQMGSYIIKGYFIFQMVDVDFKFSNPVMIFLLQDILASTKLWSLYLVISSGHKCGNPLKTMLQHVTYVPVPRFLVIDGTGYYAYCQFRINPCLQYLWISSQIYQVLKLLIQFLW
jgi:hypothetical protein